MKKILLIVCTLMLIGCQSNDKEIIIAEQYGLAYAPIQVMMANGYLEDLLPDYDITWVKLGNTMAMREAMSADALDVGFVGIPPYIIGTENGMEWGIFTGVSRAPLALMGREGDLESIGSDARIALPQPGSIQHILLSMAAKDKFGDASYFDNQLVTMKHPDGMQVLLEGNEIDYHFTSPPYIFQEKAAGMKEIITGENCFGGEFTFIVGVTSKDFTLDEEAYEALEKAFELSMNEIQNNQEATLDILMGYYNLDRQTLKTYLYDSGMVFDRDILGVDRFVEFMFENGYIKNKYEEVDLIW